MKRNIYTSFKKFWIKFWIKLPNYMCHMFQLGVIFLDYNFFCSRLKRTISLEPPKGTRTTRILAIVKI